MATDLLIGLLSLILLIFPGWLLARARGLPLPELAGFIGGAVTLLLLIQMLEFLDAGLSTRTLLPAWLLILLGAVLASRRPVPNPAPVLRFERNDRLLLLPLVPAVAVVAYRTIVQPLFGVDTIFRWNFLAEQMLSTGTLAFYPPVSAADYSIYAWPDGMAPVVSSLYFWAYTLAGSARPVLTAPVIIFQFLLVLAAVYVLTRRLASPRAAAIACALAACSPILMWSTTMGQESAVLTIALLGVLLYLPSSREVATNQAAVIAGMAAALGGLAREYGLTFIAFGLVLGIIRRLPVRTLVIFLLSALSVLPWYIRNWLHTGNPFFNLDVAGLFPVNEAHLRLMEIYQESFGWGTLPPEALRIVLTNCMAALVGGTAGALFCFKRAQALFAAALMVAGLWAVSLGYTAAGFTYSLRVLTPALALAAVLGGMAFARWVPERAHFAGLLLALFAFAGDATLRMLVLPANIYKVPPSAWLTAGGAIQEYHQRPIYRQLASHAAGQRILVLGPAALLNQNGAKTLPLWSPEVAFLWDKSVSESEAIRLLNKNGIGFLLANKGEANAAYLAQIAFFSRPYGTPLQRIWEDGDMILSKVPPSFPTTLTGYNPAKQAFGDRSRSR